MASKLDNSTASGDTLNDDIVPNNIAAFSDELALRSPRVLADLEKTIDGFSEACDHMRQQSAVEHNRFADELAGNLASCSDELYFYFSRRNLAAHRCAAGTEEFTHQLVALAGEVSEFRSRVGLRKNLHVTSSPPWRTKDAFALVHAARVLWLRPVTFPRSDTLQANFLSGFREADVEKLILPRCLVHIEPGFLMRMDCPKLEVQFPDHLETIGDGALAAATVRMVIINADADISNNFARGASCGSVLFENTTQTCKSAKKTSITIGDSFFASSTGVQTLDLRQAGFTKIGKNFAADSDVAVVQFSSRVQSVDKNLCSGCAPSTDIVMMPRTLSNHLSCLMNILSETERLEAFTQFTRMWVNSGERTDIARWLLTKSRFAIFKAMFGFSTIADLRFLGGSIQDLPVLPDDKWLWCGFKLQTCDSQLSLIHWAVKHSGQFPELLQEAQWTVGDLTLQSAQGLTALHYAVLFDVDLTALQRLLGIAAKAEVLRTWRDACSAGGVVVSPLHLAHLLHRDRIVMALLAFDWDPTEKIRVLHDPVAPSSRPLRHELGVILGFVGWPTQLGGVDAYDQAIVAVGRAKASSTSAPPNPDVHMRDESDVAPTGTLDRRPPPVGLLRAIIVLGVSYSFTEASFDDCIEKAYRRLNYWMKWCGKVAVAGRGELERVREQQQRVAHLIRSEEFESIHEEIRGEYVAEMRFFAKVLAIVLSDPEHGPDANLFFRGVVCDTNALKDFVLKVWCRPKESTPEECQNLLRDVSTNLLAALARSSWNTQEGVGKSVTAPQILLKHVQSMEDGAHKDAVESKLEKVIPFRVVFPQLPFFYLMILLVFGLSWFFHPPILAPVLMGIENTIHDYTHAVDVPSFRYNARVRRRATGYEHHQPKQRG